MANVRRRRGHIAVLAAAVMLSVLIPASAAHATPLLSGLASLDAAGDHTCGLTSGGAVECWGSNRQGEVGDGTTIARTRPQPVSISTGMTAAVAEVRLGFHHTCARTVAGAVWCWGLNDHGEIGNGFSSIVSGVLKPTKVSGLSSGVTQLAAGGQHTCALLSSGAVKCWGRNDVGQLGWGGLGTSKFTPTQVSGLTSGVTQIAASDKHTCALKAGGVLCWGWNDHGAIGNGTVTDTRVPTPVTGLTSGVSAIALGGDHSCALLTTGTVACWGFNSSGQIGNGSTADALTPAPVTGLTGVTSIAAGGAHTCAITGTGVLKCWGDNSNGQLGVGTTTDHATPVDVPTPTFSIAQVATGRHHTCLTLPSGGAKCWGDNSAGELGNGTVVELRGPFLPDPPSRPVAVAGDTTVAVSWTPPPDDGGFAVSSYTVVSTPATAPVSVPAGTLSTVFTGLHNGTAYTFVVRAQNSVGFGNDSAVSAAVTPAGLPGAPSSLSVAPSDGAATLSWHAAAANGSAPTSNRVTISPGGRTVTTAGSATSVRIGELTNGTTYTFRVRATNRVGSGPTATISGRLPLPKSGYWMLGANGTVYAFGKSKMLGSASYPQWPSGVSAVAIAPRLDGTGYWTVDNAGGVHAFGTAQFYGDHPSLPAGERVASIAATPSGRGYYLFTNRGRAVVYGDAHFFGDMSRVALNGPVIASNATPTGRGYFMVGSDGGVFTFGDARFHGSTGGIHLNKPVVGLSPTPTNGGYWLVASDGGVFAFGDAHFRGSMGAVRLNRPVNGLVPLGHGYLMVASDGGVFNFSDKPFYGSLAATPPAAPIIGIAAFVH